MPGVARAPGTKPDQSGNIWLWTPRTPPGRTSPMAQDTRALFSFPNPVNEKAARVAAAGVVVMCALAIGLGQPWLLFPLAYGFWARVLTGPGLSPLGQPRPGSWPPRRGPPGPSRRTPQSASPRRSGRVLDGHAGALVRHRIPHRRMGSARPPRGGRLPRVVPGLLPRLQGLRHLDESRRGPRRGLHRLHRHRRPRHPQLRKEPPHV